MKKQVMRVVVILLITIFLQNNLYYASVGTIENNTNENISVVSDEADDEIITEEEIGINESDNISAFNGTTKSEFTSFVEGNFKYYVKDEIVIYREEISSDSPYRLLHEYYPSIKVTDLQRDNKIQYHYRIAKDNTLKYRIETEINTQNIKFIHEFYSGSSYEDELKENKVRYQYVMNADWTLKYRIEKENGTQQTKFIHEFYPGVTYNDNEKENKVRYHYHMNNDDTLKYRIETEINTQKVKFIHEFYSGVKMYDNYKDNKIRYHYHMNDNWTLKYRVETAMNSQTIQFIHEFYANVFYEDAQKDNKIRYHYHMNADWTIKHRVETENLSQKWNFIHLYFSGSTYVYNSSDDNIEYHLHLNNDNSLKFANQTERKTGKILRRYYYMEDTFYGQGHGNRVTHIEEIAPPTSDNSWTLPVNSGVVFCILEKCMQEDYNGRHNGSDISNNRGALVYSMANGVVTEAGYHGDLGNMVGIHYHVDGIDYYAVYAHLASYNVSPGQHVSGGQVIGVVGNTGSDYYPYHLHIEIQRGVNYYIGDPVTRRRYSIGIDEILPLRLGQWL